MAFNTSICYKLKSLQLSGRRLFKTKYKLNEHHKHTDNY
jgi:hypothetical protein